MNKILLTTVIVTLLMGFKSSQEKEVYICVSVSSKRYHLSKNCKGLSKCDTIIKMITKKRAEERFGRTLCKWED